MMITNRHEKIFLEVMLWNSGFATFTSLLTVKLATSYAVLFIYSFMVLTQPFFIIYFLRAHRALKSKIAAAVSPQD